MREAELQAQVAEIKATQAQIAQDKKKLEASEAEKYLSNDSILLAPTRFGWSLSTRSTPAACHFGPVKQLYLKDAAMSRRLEKGAKLPFKLVDVPVHTVKCGLLIESFDFADVSDVRAKLNAVLIVLFRIATNTIPTLFWLIAKLSFPLR